MTTSDSRRRPCTACRDGTGLPFAITMAYQPIVDAMAGSVIGYEALVRGADGASAASVLERVDEAGRYAFDQTCRVTAIRLAASLGLEGYLSINFLPNAVYNPAACIATTLAAATDVGFDVQRLMFEVSETERVPDADHLRRIFAEYRRRGFRTAVDDFGAGYANLTLLADLAPDVVKLDRALVSGIEANRRRRAVVRGVLTIAQDLGMKVIAEGVETLAEQRTLLDLGVRYAQGYLYARPGFECLPEVDWDNLGATTAPSPKPSLVLPTLVTAPAAPTTTPITEPTD